MRRARLTVAAVAVTFASIAGTAHAAEPIYKESMTVRTSDLDLASPGGQRILHNRMADAVENVCGRNLSHIDQTAAVKAKQCRSETKLAFQAPADQLVRAANSARFGSN